MPDQLLQSDLKARWAGYRVDFYIELAQATNASEAAHKWVALPSSVRSRRTASLAAALLGNAVRGAAARPSTDSHTSDGTLAH